MLSNKIFYFYLINYKKLLIHIMMKFKAKQTNQKQISHNKIDYLSRFPPIINTEINTYLSNG